MDRKRLDNLIGLVSGYERAVVAFSAGVDSTFLAKVAYEALGSNSYAITVSSPFNPAHELDDARALAKRIGIKHLVLKIDDFDDEILANPPERCYYCKKAIFSKIKEVVSEHKIDVVMDGSNFDDLDDYRPGHRALQELGIRSPLQEERWTKAEIREWSKELELPTWEKAAFACLASRIPYEERITLDKLKMVERAEDYLKELGLRQYRVRCHGNLARVELQPTDRMTFYSDEMMDSLFAKLREIGFKFVALDCRGYRMGNMN